MCRKIYKERGDYVKIDSKYFIKELGIVDNKIEFMMDMDIFLSILSVDKVIKNIFNY